MSNNRHTNNNDNNDNNYDDSNIRVNNNNSNNHNTYIYIYIYVYHTDTQTRLTPANHTARWRSPNDRKQMMPTVGWQYILSKATLSHASSLVFCALCFIALPNYLSLLMNTCVRQVVLDKWFPLRQGCLMGACAQVHSPRQQLSLYISLSLYIYIYIYTLCVYIYIYIYVTGARACNSSGVQWTAGCGAFLGDFSFGVSCRCRVILISVVISSVYIYIYMYMYLSLSLSVYIYIYIHTCSIIRRSQVLVFEVAV